MAISYQRRVPVYSIEGEVVGVVAQANGGRRLLAYDQHYEFLGAAHSLDAAKALIAQRIGKAAVSQPFARAR